VGMGEGMLGDVGERECEVKEGRNVLGARSLVRNVEDFVRRRPIM